MKNKLKDNLLLKIISVSIAIIVWLYIQVVQSPVNDFYFYNIEVLDSDGNEIAADILKDRDLYIIEGEKPTVDVHVRTSLLKLLNLKKGSYEARVDLSGAPNSQTYPVRIVKKGDNLNDIDINVRNAKQVAIKFEKIEMKENIPVQFNIDKKQLSSEYYTDETNCDFALKISGDSMEPEIPNKSTVLIKKCDCINDGDIGAFYYDGVVYCKKLLKKDGELYLESINKKYAPIKIMPERLLEVYGIVVGVE